VQLGMKGMKNVIGAELQPAITSLMKDLFGWMKENKAQVKSFANEFGERLKAAIPVIKDVAVGFASMAKGIGTITRHMAGFVGGFDNLGMILAFVFAMKPVMAILAFGKSIAVATHAVLGFSGALPYMQAGLSKTLLGAKWLGAGLKTILPKAGLLFLKFGKGMVSILGVASKALWAFTAGLAKMGIALLANPITWIVAGIAAAVAGAAYLIYKNWDGISGWFSDRWKDVKTAFAGGLAGVGKLLMNWSPFGLLYKGFQSILSWFGVDLPEQFSGFGKAIINGLIGGITSGFGAAKDAIVSVGESAIGWFKDVLGIKSPSRVFMSAGRDTMEGYRRGIQKQEPNTLKQVSGFGKRVRQVGAGIAIGASTLPAAAGNVQFDDRAPVASQPQASGQASGDQYTFQIYGAPGQDEREIAAQIERILQERDRRNATRARSALYDRE